MFAEPIAASHGSVLHLSPTGVLSYITPVHSDGLFGNLMLYYATAKIVYYFEPDWLHYIMSNRLQVHMSITNQGLGSRKARNGVGGVNSTTHDADHGAESSRAGRNTQVTGGLPIETVDLRLIARVKSLAKVPHRVKWGTVGRRGLYRFYFPLAAPHR